MRIIGSLTPVWNQEMWILPHFKMLSELNKNVVLLQERPLPNYFKEHGYSAKPDLSEHLLQKHFPEVEIYPSRFEEGREFGADLYNDGLEYVQDCDIVFRLDPDMFFTDEVWKTLITHIQESEYNCYHMKFDTDSINYYMTGDFEHGLKDAQEVDALAWNPKRKLRYLEWADPNMPGIVQHADLACPWDKHHFIDFPGFMCHHFRGWNKPKSTPNPAWGLRPETFELVEAYGNSGEFYLTPLEIENKVSDSLRVLKLIKDQKEQ